MRKSILSDSRHMLSQDIFLDLTAKHVADIGGSIIILRYYGIIIQLNFSHITATSKSVSPYICHTVRDVDRSQVGASRKCIIPDVGHTIFYSIISY